MLGVLLSRATGTDLSPVPPPVVEDFWTAIIAATVC
jgi:hypothetical protein